MKFFDLLKKKKQGAMIEDKGVLGTVDERFEALLTEENFPGYIVRQNVHVGIFDREAHPCCYPISYLFSKGDVPVLAVFLMNRNQYRSMIARGSYHVLDSMGITRMNFYRECENEESYVLNRIRDSLNN